MNRLITMLLQLVEKESNLPIGSGNANSTSLSSMHISDVIADRKTLCTIDFESLQNTFCTQNYELMPNPH